MLNIAILGVVIVAVIVGYALSRANLESANPLVRRGAHFYRMAQTHPVKAYALVETGLWLFVLASLIDHVFAANGFSSTIIWYLTIGPHEIGHFICMPFGQLLYIAGGSIWQILFWVILAVNQWLGRRQITGSLLLWAVAGHSFVNLARYVGDASARQMPLLFGMGPEHHDWYNLLNMTNLLRFDKFFALLTTLMGIAVVLTVVGLGILTAWLLPRTALGRIRRFEGSPLRAFNLAFIRLQDSWTGL